MRLLGLLWIGFPGSDGGHVDIPVFGKWSGSQVLSRLAGFMMDADSRFFLANRGMFPHLLR